MATKQHVAIVGAGLSGLGMALALQARSVKCTVYEQSPATGRFAGALMLSPNSLRILDQYGVYGRIRNKGYNFDVVEIRDSEGILKDNGFYLGSRELFGYDALRIYRNVLLKELTAACVERGIHILYDKKFSEVLSEDENGVKFTFQDGSIAQTDLLIAADGIYSKVRSALFPRIKPEYNGVLVVCGSVKASSLVDEEAGQRGQPQTNNVNMLEGKDGVGAFLLGAQLPDASELLAGTQRRFPDQPREEWARLATDRAFHLDFLHEGYESRLPVVQRAVDNIMEDSTYIWPLQTLPRMERWWSDRTGRIIFIGDAAHAMPPTSAQGANQGFEDTWTLARVLSDVFSNTSLGDTTEPAESTGSNNEIANQQERLKDYLQHWHIQRQYRIDEILALTQKLHNLRLPLEEQRKLPANEIWTSFSREQDSSRSGGANVEGDAIQAVAAEGEVNGNVKLKEAVIEQWGWLYCPDDLMKDLDRYKVGDNGA